MLVHPNKVCSMCSQASAGSLPVCQLAGPIILVATGSQSVLTAWSNLPVLLCVCEGWGQIFKINYKGWGEVSPGDAPLERTDLMKLPRSQCAEPTDMRHHASCSLI